jgi:predicted  nucleic acid-binding Zn-ribbon protein
MSDFVNLQLSLKRIEERLDRMDKKLDKLEEHIDFINKTYDDLKNPITAARKFFGR